MAPILAETCALQIDEEGAHFGGSVAGAGDVNGDGFADVVVGAEPSELGQPGEGRAYLYLGSAGGLATVAAWSADAGQLAHFGSAVAAAGDVDGDGYADVLVGAPLYDDGQVDEGRAYLFRGTAAGLEATAAWTTGSDQDDAYLGGALAGVGDVDGDGYDDVVVAAHAYDTVVPNDGRIALFRGSALGLEVTASWTAAADRIGAALGVAVAGAGDVNGDGYADVVAGAPGYTHGEREEGAAFLYLGSAAGLGAAPAWSVEGDEISGHYATAVSGAGDVNGDGYADVLIGGLYGGIGGRVDLFLGSAAGLAATPAWTHLEPQPNALFGASVAAAGDVDGDGFDDVVVGANGYDGGVYDEGRAFLYRGTAAGLEADPAWTADGDQEDAAFGWAVAGAGDLDADGHPDLVVGAFYFSSGEPYEGRVVPYLGGVEVPDADLDGVPDACDTCAGADDGLDDDLDGVPEACDACPLDLLDDSDGDGSCDSADACPGYDDAADGDLDGVADGCDDCPLDPLDDSDGDGSCDADDLCPTWDDDADLDGDGVPDRCDPCKWDPLDDSDGDGSCDRYDTCPGADDALDADGDALPDDCDPCDLGPADDADGDTVADACDPCPHDAADDSDGDGSCDGADACPGADDALDADGDGLPDACDACPADAGDDSDGDGSCDGADACPGGDDRDDADGDGIPDACDACDAGPDDACAPEPEPEPEPGSEPEPPAAGSGCASAPSSTGGWFAGLVLLAARRRAIGARASG